MATRWRLKQQTAPTVAGENTRRKLVVRGENPLRCTAEAESGDPRIAVTAEAGSGDSRMAVTAEAGSGDPKMAVTAEAGSGDPRMAVTAEAGSGDLKMSVTAEAGSGDSKMAVTAEETLGNPRMTVIADAGSGDPKMAVTAKAGSGDAKMTVTGDRRLQVGSCGQRPEASSNQHFLTDDRQNLKKIKEAKNRQPEADYQSFSDRWGNVREVLPRDSGNIRLGAGSALSKASQVSPRYTRHAVYSSEKLACQSGSFESFGPHLSAFHPDSRKSPITSTRRTDSEKSGSAQCRNNRMTMFANKTPAKYSSTKQLAHEQIENKEVKLASKLSESQTMHKLPTAGKLHNKQIGERKTVVVGLSRNEQDGAQRDSPVLSKKKVKPAPQQNITSSFNRTCTQATHLSKDSRTEQLSPHNNSKPCNRTTVSREQINEKNKDEFCRDLKLMKSTTSLTPGVRRKTKTKQEYPPLMGSVSGEQASDNKENPQNVEECAKKHACYGNESPQAFQKFTRGHVSGRNKSPLNIQDLHKEHDNSAPYYETDSSLQTSASRSLSSVQNAINAEVILKTNASGANMKESLAAGEDTCLVTVCQLVGKPRSLSTEVICHLPDNSEEIFLQLVFQNENMQDISSEMESYNFRSKKHQKPGVDKSRANIMFQSNLCDSNKEENKNEELMCDINRVSKEHHGEDGSNGKAGGSCQGLSGSRDKNHQVSEKDVAKVSLLCLDMQIDDAKVQNVCPEQQSDNSKLQNVYLELESGYKFQKVKSKFQNDNSKFQIACQELEADNIKFQHVCEELYGVRTEFQNSNSKLQSIGPEIGAEENAENSSQENDTVLQIQGLWQQLKSKKDPSNQAGVDFSMWKRTGLLNKILDKGEFNMESLSSLIPQLDEDCTGIMSPLDFKVLNIPTRDFGTPQGKEDENNFYDEKLEKALKESEQLLDELRMLTGRGMDLMLSPREEVEDVVPGVHRRVDDCKKDLKMFMA